MALHCAKRKNMNKLQCCTFEVNYKPASVQMTVLHSYMYLCSGLPGEYKHPFALPTETLSNKGELTWNHQCRGHPRFSYLQKFSWKFLQQMRKPLYRKCTEINTKPDFLSYLLTTGGFKAAHGLSPDKSCNALLANITATTTVVGK